MSTFKNLNVSEDITGCVADYIIERGKEGYCNWEKYKSGKLVQYGSTSITAAINNRGGTGQQEYHLYNSVLLSIDLEIPNLDREYCNITCISSTGSFAVISKSYITSTTRLGFWLYNDLLISSESFIIHFIDIGTWK